MELATIRQEQWQIQDTSLAVMQLSAISPAAKVWICASRAMPATMVDVSLQLSLQILLGSLTFILGGVTYLAGCSDPTYEDESCPDKRELSGEFILRISDIVC